jgi:general secretion pathway protein F
MRFTLKAVEPSGEVVDLGLEAADDAAAWELARQRGYAVLRVSRAGLPTLTRRRKFDATLLSIELLALLDAGLNVVEGLQALAARARGEQRRVLDALLGALRRGEPLSRAVAGVPDAFTPLYVATIRSSERTGDLKEALRRYVAYQEQVERVRRKVLSALLYPAILSVVGTLVLAFLVFYVVPRFARVYEDMSANLPFFSSVLLGVGRFVEQQGLAVLVVGGAAAVALAYFLSRPETLARTWNVPVLGERLRVYQLARLYRTVGMLLRAGIPAVRAFEMVSGLLAEYLRPRLNRAIGLLKEGNAISAALTSTGLTTPVVERMMAVGEKSGRMGELLERAAAFCDDETARFVDASTRVFDPLLMAMLGLAVGAVVVLMYMPVFELAGSIR